MKGWERQFHAGSNLAIGIVFVCALITAPAHALLMGEKASRAPVNGLKRALMLYQQGNSHEQVWVKTKWYCPLRTRVGCRFEVAGKCTGVNRLNMIALKHTSFTGQIPLAKVFNASCVWQQYPHLRQRVVIYFEDCGNSSSILGTAHPEYNGTGKICIDGTLLKKVFSKLNSPIVGKKRVAEARDRLHRVFIHELQHHIQYAEKWPPRNHKCPYRRRLLEREAFYVADTRGAMNYKERKKHPPHWYRSGLC